MTEQEKECPHGLTETCSVCHDYTDGSEKAVDPNILTVNVAEEINTEEAGIGGGKPKEDRGQAEYYERVMKYLQRYVAPHKVKSRWVTNADIETLKSEGDVMVNLCTIPKGMYGNVAAIAHSQIEDKEPLRFFAMPDGLLVINPVIFRHTNAEIEKSEGCMSFTEEPMKKVPLYHKITVLYQVIKQKEDGSLELSDVIEEGYAGPLSAIFQHECSHLNGKYIYDEDYQASDAIGFGDCDIIDVDELKAKYGTN